MYSSEKLMNNRILLCYENKESINISYCYNDDLDDYIEICTNTDLYHFAKNKMHSIIFFIRWFIHKWMDLSYKNYRHIINKYLINEYNEIITINKKINAKKINYIISEYWNHCKFNKEIFNIDDLFNKYKNIIYLYFENTSFEITEPNAERCLYWAKYEMFKLFYNNIYLALYFNYNLYPFYKDIKSMDSLFGYKNVINSDVIINLLRGKGYYIPYKLEKSKNLIRFVEELGNQGPIFLYIKYFDFTELIKAIKNTRFHYNDNLNSLFQIRAINYIINGDSLIHIFIHELITIISTIDRKELQFIKHILFKVYNENEINSSLNSSRFINTQNEKNANINQSPSNSNEFKNIKTKKK